MVSEDMDITPEGMLTTWGTQKIRQIGQKVKKNLEIITNGHRATRGLVLLKRQRIIG